MGKKKTGKRNQPVSSSKVALKVYVDPAVRRRLRLTAADQDRKTGDLVTDALDAFLPEWKP